MIHLRVGLFKFKDSDRMIQLCLRALFTEATILIFS